MRLLFVLLAGLALVGTSTFSKESASHGQPQTAFDPPSATALVNVTLHFKEPRLEELNQRMLDISRSGGAWLTDEELATYISPSPQAINEVVATLSKLGITSYTQSRSKDELYFQTTGDMVEKHFSTNFSPHLYGAVTRASQLERAAARRRRRKNKRPHKVAMAAAVAGQHKRRSLVNDCDPEGILPNCVRSLYNVSYIPQPSPPGVVDLAVLLPYGAGDFSRHDLRHFLSTFQPVAKDAVVETVFSRNATTDYVADDELAIEATVVQLAAAQAWTQRITANVVGNNETEEDLFTASWRDFIEGPAESRPGVTVTSFSTDELYTSLDESLVMCRTAMKLSALGTTIVTALGDAGVRQDDFKQGCPPFTTDFLSACPYVLGIGGTQGFPPNVSVAMSRGNPDDIDSSAGLSRFWEAPDFQKPFLEPYIASLGDSLDAGKINKKGRSSPDLVAIAVHIALTFRGEDVVIPGNSAAAPMVAALLTLLNGARRDHGRGRLGWIHPLLYANPSSFDDVTKGGSYGCGNTSLGFPAKEGFDVASGLGSPVFSKLLDVVLA